MSVALERLARRQTLFREVNERIEDLTDSQDKSMEILCECSDTECLATLDLRKEDYECVRSVPTWFAIERGHEIPEIERVVEEFDGYVVVEKFVEQEYAEETDGAVLNLKAHRFSRASRGYSRTSRSAKRSR